MIKILKQLNSKLWESSQLPEVCKVSPTSDVPIQYDFREKYSQCKGKITSQGEHSTAYALITSSVIADRLCIKDSKRIEMSPEYIYTCSSLFNSSMGNIYDVVNYIKTAKIPMTSCFTDESISNICGKNCNEIFPSEKVLTACRVFDDDNIKREIINNGPVVANIRLKTDFPTYKSGIYQYKKGPGVFNITQDHLVKIIGWGETNDLKYWIIENTWGEEWGEDGYAKIEISETDGIMTNEVLSIMTA